MEQQKGNTQARKGKHLNWNERILIEGFLKAKMTRLWIAGELGRDRRTIAREIERGMVDHINSDLTVTRVYNADRAQDVHDLNATGQRPEGKAQGQQHGG